MAPWQQPFVKLYADRIMRAASAVALSRIVEEIGFCSCRARSGYPRTSGWRPLPSASRRGALPNSRSGGHPAVHVVGGLALGLGSRESILLAARANKNIPEHY